jgi:hypothetical protein
VRTIGAQRADTEVVVILGVETHLDFHVAVVVDHLGREAWARQAGHRTEFVWVAARFRLGDDPNDVLTATK